MADEIRGDMSGDIHISKLPSITAEIKERLKAVGITSQQKLLEIAAKSADRLALARTCEIEYVELTRLVCRADLNRIGGLGAAFANLLNEAGILAMDVLADQAPEALHAALEKANRSFRLRRPPTPHEVSNWVASAKKYRGLVTLD